MSFKLDSELDKACEERIVTQLECDGLGLYKGEGYGRIAVNRQGKLRDDRPSPSLMILTILTNRENLARLKRDKPKEVEDSVAEGQRTLCLMDMCRR